MGCPGPQKAPEYLSFTIGSESEEYLYAIDLAEQFPSSKMRTGESSTSERKEVKKMWNEPTKEQLAKIPGLYETEEVPLEEKLVFLHFFIGGSDWFICEYDGEDLFWATPSSTAISKWPNGGTFRLMNSKA